MNNAFEGPGASDKIGNDSLDRRCVSDVDREGRHVNAAFSQSRDALLN